MRAAAFSTLLLMNLALIVASLAERRGLRAELSSGNRALGWTAGGAALTLLLALTVPALRELFHFEPLGREGALVMSACVAAGAAAMSLAPRDGRPA